MNFQARLICIVTYERDFFHAQLKFFHCKLNPTLGKVLKKGKKAPIVIADRFLMGLSKTSYQKIICHNLGTGEKLLGRNLYQTAFYTIDNDQTVYEK